MGHNPNRAVLGPIDRLFRSGTASGFSDGQLLERFATRHDEAAEAAFAALVERHGPMVLNVCRRVLRDPDDAQDAFQATFLVLVRKARSVHRHESVAAWLHGVARRVSAHARASAARRRRAEGEIEPRPAVAPDVPAGGEVWEEVDRLPADLRAAVVLCYLEGQTHEQAAGRLGWPVGTVRSRLARARDRLRTRLRSRGLHPDAAMLAPLTLKPAALPAHWIGPVARSAMLVAARDGVDAGLVSASAAALTEGVIRTMFVSQCKSAALALFAAGAVATGASVYAYQDPAPPPATAAAEPAGPRTATAMQATSYGTTVAADPPTAAGIDSDLTAARRQMLAVFANGMETLVKAARQLQDRGNHQAAAHVTEKMAQFAGQWQQALGDSAAVVSPNPVQAAAAGPGDRALGHTAAVVLPNAPAAPPMPKDVFPPPAGRPGPNDNDRRLDEVERKLDRILRRLEGGVGPEALDPGDPRPDALPPPPASGGGHGFRRSRRPLPPEAPVVLPDQSGLVEFNSTPLTDPAAPRP